MNRILGALILVSIVGCSTAPYKPYAREVKKKPTVEGVIALKAEHIAEDRTYADTLMARNCGSNPVNVLEEGEVQVGETTISNSQVRDEKEANGLNFGGFKYLTGGSTDVKNKAETRSTVALKEWHISYNCGQVATNTTKTKTATKKK